MAVRVFVGREPELRVLRACWAAARAGRGGAALVMGEPGIGKTSLVEALAAEVRLQGERVAWGRCWEGEGGPAFWPWSQALRRCLEPPSAPLPPDLAALAPLVEGGPAPVPVAAAAAAAAGCGGCGRCGR